MMVSWVGHDITFYQSLFSHVNGRGGYRLAGCVCVCACVCVCVYIYILYIYIIYVCVCIYTII